MDEQSEIARAKWLLGAAVFFLVSCYVSYSELAYLIRGRNVDANLVQAYEQTKTEWFGLRKETRLVVDYSFSDPDGGRRIGTDNVDPSWPLPGDGKVPVRYTPGANGRSRLAGHVKWGGIVMFIVSVTVMGAFAFRLWREAVFATQPRKSKLR